MQLIRKIWPDATKSLTSYLSVKQEMALDIQIPSVEF